MPETTEVVDRSTGRIEEEIIYGKAALEAAYGTVLGRAVMRILPQGVLSRAYGIVNRLPTSRRKVRPFAEGLGIDVDEAELGLSEYRTLDEFFCRKLKPSARPVDESPNRFVSPADGRVLVYPYVGDSEFLVKGCTVSILELLQNADLAKRYEKGAAAVVRLAPCDYHRFHFPDSGHASASETVRGRLHSVHPIALESGAPSFRNKRSIAFLESENFGSVAVVEIGAFAVGTIVQTYRPGPVTRGEEKGFFRLGGSTVVVLTPPNRLQFDDDLVQNSRRGLETLVRMGTSIGGVLPG